jgi:hypothetical protein
MHFPITGLYSRGVFDDSLFVNHDFQWGDEHWSDGFLSRTTINRTWESWWKLEHISGPPPNEPWRHIQVSVSKWEEGLLSRNLKEPWIRGPVLPL